MSSSSSSQIGHVLSVSENFSEKYSSHHILHHRDHNNLHPTLPTDPDNHHPVPHHSKHRPFLGASRISPSSFLFPWRTRSFVVPLISCLFLVGVTSAYPAPVSGNGVGPDGESLPIVAPFVRCTQKLVCDLRTHYCDPNIQNCASCEEDCSSARIQGDHYAEKSCKRKCEWYYAMQLEHRAWRDSVTSPAGLPDQLESTQNDSEPVNITLSLTVAIIIVILVGCILLLSFSNVMAWIHVIRHCSKTPRRASKTSQDQNAHCRPNDYVDLVQGQLMNNSSLKASHKSSHTGQRIYAQNVDENHVSQDNSIQPLVTAPVDI